MFQGDRFDDKDFLTRCRPEIAQRPVTREASIVTGTMADLLRVADQKGADLRPILGRVGMAHDFLEHPPDTIPLRQFVVLSQTTSQVMGYSDFGWSTGTVFHLENLGPVGHAMITADTVGTALRLLCGALQAVQGASAMSLGIEGDKAVIHYRVLDPKIWPRCQDTELTLSVVARTMRLARGGDWRPDWLGFEHAAPDLPNDRRARFGVRYNSDINEIRFPAAHLETPMPGRDRNRHRDHVNDTVHLGRGFATRMEIPARLRQTIFERFGCATLDQTDIAQSLGLSRRGLRRRLADHHTSYSEILSDCRTGFAVHRLRHSHQTIAEIAYELGYSDQSAFERAFRRDMGLTPTKFRQNPTTPPILDSAD